MKKNRLFIEILIFSGALFFVFALSFLFYRFSFKNTLIKKENFLIIINDNGLSSKTISQSVKVKDLLVEKGIKLKTNDLIFPDFEENLTENTQIIIQRSKELTLNIGGEKKEYFTAQSTVKSFLENEKIDFSSDDKILPSLESKIFSGSEITIIKVLRKEVAFEKKIPFEVIYKEDPNLAYSKSKIIKEGKNGLQKEEYEVVYENGRETKRTLIKKEIIKEPEEEIVLQGTKITPLSEEKGFASWYFGLGSMCAAHKTLPFGTKVRVIAQNSGKSVIVVINDRGPYVDGRVIDLSDDAFEKIAPLGAGVISVIAQRIN